MGRQLGYGSTMLTQAELQALVALLGDVGKSLELLGSHVLRMAGLTAPESGEPKRFHYADTLAALLEEHLLEETSRVVAIYALYALFRPASSSSSSSPPVFPDHPYLTFFRSLIEEDIREIEAKA